MYFPVAGIEVHPLIPPLVAFVVSSVTSMGGVSGAFLLLPFQVSVLGFTSPAVSATNQIYNIVAIPSGVYRFVREGRMVWPLTWIVVAGTLPGVCIGAVIRVRLLPDANSFKLFVGVVLLYIGARLIGDVVGRTRAGEQGAERRFQDLIRRYRSRTSAGEELPRTKVEEFSPRRLVYSFYGERFAVPVLPVFVISGVVGLVGGTYGIGGGAILAPLYVTYFGLPIYTVAGATLLGTLITSVAGVGFYHSIAPFYPGVQVSPDWGLGLLFGVGGLAGMYCGARLQKLVPARTIKGILAASLLILAARYFLEWLLH